MVAGGLLGDDETLGDLGVAQALATSARTSSSRAVRPAGLARVPGARPARQAARATLAQAPGDDRRGWLSAELEQLVQRAARGHVVVGLRRAPAPPRSGSRDPASAPRRPASRRPPRAQRARPSRPPQPLDPPGPRAGATRRARRPPSANACAGRARALRTSPRRRRRRSPPSHATSACATATGSAAWSSKLRASSAAASSTASGHVAVAPPRAHAGDRRQRDHPRQSRAARLAHDLRGRLHRVVPAPEVELERGAVRQQVGPPDLQPALGRVAQAPARAARTPGRSPGGATRSTTKWTCRARRAPRGLPRSPARGCARAVRGPRASPAMKRAAPTLFSAWMWISSSPSRAARSIARSPHATAPSTSSASMQIWAKRAYAIASSRPGVTPSRTSTAIRAASDGLGRPPRAPQRVGRADTGRRACARTSPTRWRSSIARCSSDDRLAGLLGQHALVRAALEQLGALGRRQRVGEAQGPRVLGDALAVRADRRGAPGRLGREAQHRQRVAGRLGVVGEPRGIGGVVERRERPGVQRDAPRRRASPRRSRAAPARGGTRPCRRPGPTIPAPMHSSR